MLYRTIMLAIALAFATLTHADGAASESRLVRRIIPTEDPGPPFYARVGLQFFDNGQWIAISFYRQPECIPADFNLLQFFHFPGGPGHPGAFGCPLLVSGFLLTEADAPPGTFPKRVHLQGVTVPVWFVDSAAFRAAAADGELTIGDLQALSPLQGVARFYHETLHPRTGEHLIVIEARGDLPDGRRFAFFATQVEDELEFLRIAFHR
jgi:hypothetical protein